MLIFLFFYLTLLLWLIHPIFGWISLLIVLFYFIKHKKQIKKSIFVFCLFLGLTFLASYTNKTKIDGKYQGMVIKSNDNFFLFSSELTNYYVYFEDNPFEVGDILSIDGYRLNLSYVNLESEFDFEAYLENLNVHFELKIKEINVINKTFIRVNKIKKIILNNYQEQEEEYIKAILFSIYSEEVMSTGIIVVLVNSGLIFYSILTILKRILNHFFNERITSIIIYVITFPFIILSSFKIGIIKAYLLSLNNDFKLNWKREKIYHYLLLITLFHNPLYFKNAGFYYIFLIPFFLPYLSEALNCFSFKTKSLMRSILFQIIYLPFFLYFQKGTTFLGFIFILILKYIFGGMLLLTYLLLLFPHLSFIINLFAKLYFFIINIVSKINITFHYDYINEFFILLLFVVIALILICFEKNNKKHGGIILLSLYTCLFFSSSEVLVNFNSYISFINVGQGDCALIHDKNTNVLIDVGGNLKKDIAVKVLIPYFQKKGIKRIDYIFLSHDDYDHSGALDSLISNFKVEGYYKGSDFKKYRINNLTFYNLNTFGDGSLENDDSSVIKLKFYTKTYLFCGDISKDIEIKIINNYDVNADILKLSHHGSSTSSSYEFLKAVSPKEAVISVGKNNYYHHPSKEVLSRLKKLDIKIRRTDQEGSITYKENKFSFLGFIYISLKSNKNRL